MRVFLFSVFVCLTLNNYAQNPADHYVQSLQPVHPGKNTDGQMKASEDNYYTFPERKKSPDLEAWGKYNSKKDLTHPEYGILPDGAPCDTCVEVYAERKADKRLFRSLKDSTLQYIQQSLGSLNTLVDGRWITIQHKLKPGANGVYRSGYAPEPAIFDLSRQQISLQTVVGNVKFNDWTLLIRRNGTVETIGKANWSRYTIGEDGMYITNVFEGIDAELKVFRGAIKTNFIIKRNAFGSFDELIFRDAFNSGQNTRLQFTEGNEQKGVGQLTVLLNGADALKVNAGYAYAKNGGKESMMAVAYDISDGAMDMIVPAYWINKYIGQHELVIDPLVTASNTLAQAAITGSAYGAACFTAYCSYNLNVTRPASFDIEDIRWTFSYIATGSCWMYDGAVTFRSGTCNSPGAAGNYWFCNGIGTGTCSGNNISIMNDLASCLPAASCASANIPFEMRFYRCYTSSAGCSGSCIGAASPWTMTITGRTVELASPVTITPSTGAAVCQGTSAMLTATGRGGVSPYGYSWSFNPTGTPVAATGASANLTFPANGTIPVYLTLTDACGNTNANTVNVTVNPRPVVTAIPAINPLCSGQNPNIALNSSVTGTTYTWTASTVPSITGVSAGSGTGPISQTLTNSATLPGTVSYNITSTANGCTSTPVNSVITVNPLKTATQNITICTNQLPYTWNGQTITAGGNSVATFTTPSLMTGCDSTTTLNLVVNSVTSATQTVTICSNALPYTWNGQTITAGGNGVATYTTPSLTSGCDSTTTLNLIVNTVTPVTQTITICSNALPYTWNGQTITAGGNGIATYTTPSLINGCDSTTTLNLVVNNLPPVTQTITICANALPYTWNGQTITAGGNGVATYTTPSLVNGCDSTTSLNLVVNPLINTTQTISICANQLPYTWNAQPITAGGNAVATFTTPSLVTGCDSTTTLNLIVNPLINQTVNLTICASSMPYTWNGQTINAGGNGVATFTTPSLVTGCDSTTTLNLIVNALISATENITICSNQLPYSWNGQSITAGGTAVATFTTPSAGTGCDSTTTLNLTVNLVKNAAENIVICADALPYNWNGQSITAGGNNVATFTMPSTENGCDSTTTLNLTVNPAPAVTQTITICADALPYTWNGQTMTAGGNNVATFVTPSIVTGCDSTTTLNLIVNPLINQTETITICADALPFTWNGQSITAGGNNVATFITPSLITGCDSTTVLNLIVNPLINQTEAITICADALPFTWNGQSITAGGNNVATFITPSLITGCDSTTVLNLIVNPLINQTETITICADALPYTWNGQSIAAGGNAVASFVTPSLITGCDSTTVLNLIVNPLINETETITICADALPYTWNGQSITAGGNNVATFTMPSQITGCDSTTVLNLIVNTAPAITLQPQPSVIFIQDNTSFSVTASGTGPLTYQWEVNDGAGFAPVTDGMLYSGSQSPTLTLTNVPHISGYLYRCIVTGICLPNATGNAALLTVNKRPQTISFNTQTSNSTVTVTYGDPVQDGSATASSGLPVTYSSSNNGVASIDATGQITIHSVGTTLIAADQAGDNIYLGASPVIFTLVVTPKNLLITADDKTRPYGENNPPLTFSYSGFVYGENQSVITPPVIGTTATLTSMPGQYPITFSGGTAANYNFVFVNGTFTITGAVVNIRQQPAPLALCTNEQARFTIIAEAQSPLVTLQYQWQQSGNNSTWTDIPGATTSQLTMTALTSAYIRCVITAPGTVLPSQSVTFVVHPLPTLQVTKSNDLDCNFGSTQLTVSGAIRYNWTPPAGLSSTTIYNPLARPTTETKYYVTGTDANGCVNRDSITVEITDTRHGDNLMANAFTPNGDGRNDCYGISYWGVIEKIDFSIYNRGGQRIFYSRDPYACWNGKFQGVDQPAGVYVYFIKAVTNCGVIERKGTVTLIR
ncbi:T9SS C-terminal target domain-containing protein [Terrimonas ferruginea]|uniref:T9SS C-terminal target domain-containing protein n=1 Tax=Terrimonas ferruginea TaxID=249 RepID=UPI000411A259|nr:T9SS C-terminal target domain-containing protein [Terrimonas ferruginea]